MMSASRFATTGLIAGVVFGLANTGTAALIGYYAMNETNNPSVGTGVADSSPSVQNGTMLSDAVPTVGATEGIASVNPFYGTAFSFNASSTDLNYVDVNPFAGLTRDGALTYAMWIKPGATQLSEPTMIGSNGRGYDLRLAPSGSDWNVAFKNGTSVFSLITTATVATDVWTHVAVTKDVNGSGGTNLANVSFYINGSLVQSGTIGRAVTNNPARLFLGTGALTNQYYNGGLDEVHVYNEVLDANAIAGLAVVPEPSAMFLVVLGSIGMIGTAFRRRAI
jgi:hypothetical protein